MDTIVHLRRAIHLPPEGPPRLGTAEMRAVFELDWMKDGIFHRAHPSWVIALPPRNARVILEGLRPEGRVDFALPALRVVADFVFGEATGSRALAPHMLVLLPEERRFYLVYRHRFNLAPHADDLETSFRLRLEESWYDG